MGIHHRPGADHDHHLLRHCPAIEEGITLRSAADPARCRDRPAIGLERIFEVARSVPEAEIESWEDVDRLDVRPGEGVVKVRCKNRYEVQIDTETAEILHVAVRRSDLIESIHDGSYFNDHFKLWVFLPAGIVLAMLVITGIYLFLLPYLVRRKRVR